MVWTRLKVGRNLVWAPMVTYCHYGNRPLFTQSTKIVNCWLMCHIQLMCHILSIKSLSYQLLNCFFYQQCRNVPASCCMICFATLVILTLLRTFASYVWISHVTHTSANKKRKIILIRWKNRVIAKKTNICIWIIHVLKVIFRPFQKKWKQFSV